MGNDAQEQQISGSPLRLHVPVFCAARQDVPQSHGGIPGPFPPFLALPNLDLFSRHHQHGCHRRPQRKPLDELSLARVPHEPPPGLCNI